MGQILHMAGRVGAWAVILTLFVVAWQSIETGKAAKATENVVREAASSRALAEKTAIKPFTAHVGDNGARLLLHDDGAVEAKVEVFNCGQTPVFDSRGLTGEDLPNTPF